MPDWLRLVYIGSFSWWGFALARWDFREHRLPDALTLPAYPIAGLILVVVAPQNLSHATIAAVIALAGGWVANSTADLGMGDVKLLGACALATGVTADPLGAAREGLILALVLGGIHAAIHLAITRDRRANIPLGPAILVATFVALVRG